jgi:hypothetical protein
MPANLSPEYKAAAEALRRARDPAERLEHLREMLRVIPKHKGTDHLQADLRHRIKELDEELAGPKKGGTRSAPALVVRPEGAAQVAEQRQVGFAREADRLERARRALSVHDPVPRTRHDAGRGRLPAAG